MRMYLLSTSMLVLKSTLNTLSEALDGALIILTTVLAMTNPFVPFCSAQDGESAVMNCLVFIAHCKNGKI